jgi:hypothetical protein
MNNNISGSPAIFELNPYVQHKYQMHQLGLKAECPNGDIYRYAKLGADVATGLLLSAVLGDDNHHNVTLSAIAAVGATEVKPTVGATAVTAGMFNEGTLVFNDVAPEGHTYEIIGHTASAAGSEVITVKIAPDLKVAATASSQVSLFRNQWNAPTIQHIVTTRPVGVAIMAWDVSEAGYGWLKTKGIVSVLADATGTTKGYFGCISDQTDGAIGVVSDDDQEDRICQYLETGTAGEYNAVYMFID